LEKSRISGLVPETSIILLMYAVFQLLIFWEVIPLEG
jgi:hypothetical protein